MLNLNNSLTVVLMLASTLAVQAAPSPGYGYGSNEAPADNVVYYTKTVQAHKTITQTANSYETPVAKKEYHNYNNGAWSWKKTWKHKHHYTKPTSAPAPVAPKSQDYYQAPAYTPKAPEPKPSPEPETPEPETETPEPETPKTPAGSSLEKGMIEGHNTLREQYGAGPLTWSSELAASSEQHAQKCVFEHSGDEAGENIAGGSDIPGVCKMWGADEASSFGGHFTQMVWKGTKQVGCARVDCTGKGVVGDYFTVCQYLPAGNMQGAYAENVQGYQ